MHNRWKNPRFGAGGAIDDAVDACCGWSVVGSELVPAIVALRHRRGHWGSLLRQGHRFQILLGRRQFRRGPPPRPRHRRHARCPRCRRSSLCRLRHASP